MADIAKLIIAIEETGGKATARVLDNVEKSTKDADKASKNYNKTKKKSKDLNKGLIGSVDGLAMSLKTLGATALAGATVAIVKMGVEQERVRKEFEILVGSVEQGNKVFDRLNDLANKTPLDNFDLFPVARSLLAFGTSADDLNEKLTVLGDLALGDANKLARLADAYGKVQVKGKATLEELNRFAEAGVPVFEALAENMGVTREQLFKMVSAGKVGFNDLDNALASLTEEGSKFHDMMGQISETSAGRLSTAMGSAKLVMAELGEKTLPAVNQGLDLFIGMVKGANLAIDKGFIESIKELTTIFTGNDGLTQAMIDTDFEASKMGLASDTYWAKAIEDGTQLIELYQRLGNQVDEISTKMTDFTPMGEGQVMGKGEGAKLFKNPIPDPKEVKKQADKAKKDAVNWQDAEMSIAKEHELELDQLREERAKKAEEFRQKEADQRSKGFDDRQKAAEANEELERYQTSLELSEQQMRLEQAERYNSARVEGEKERVKKIKEIQDQELASYQAMFGGFASLFGVMASEHKKWGNFYKAFALAEIVISTQRGIMNAMATGNVPLALGIGAEGVASGITVAQQEFTDSGIVMGQPTGDTTMIGANGGELMINPLDQRFLVNMMKGANGGGGDNITMNFSGDTPSSSKRFAREFVRELENTKRQRTPYQARR